MDNQQKRQRLNNTDPNLSLSGPGSSLLTTTSSQADNAVSGDNDKWGVKNWGDRYFSINPAGHICVEPTGRGGDAPKIDLYHLVQDCIGRGHSPPLLIRFSNIIDDKIRALNAAFERYCDKYQQVFPLRVAPSRTILENVVKNPDVGLCASSKPELLIVLAMLPSRGRTIICTGFKDVEYVETALLAQQLGQVPIIIIEKKEELDLILSASTKLGIKPILGIRTKIVSVQLKNASEQVSDSHNHRSLHGFSVDVGDRAKFGLSATEIMQVVGRLKEANLLDSLQMMHFHIGSQISNITAIRQATREAVQYYVQLYKLGANMKYLDVGGGLAVDYDGSHTNNPMSLNYSVDEYASEIVNAIKSTLNQPQNTKIPFPVIVSEAGRNVVAHHSVVIFNVTDATTVHPLKASIENGNLFGSSIESPISTDHELCHKMYELLRNIDATNLQETIHDAKQYKDEALALFTLGMMDLTTRSKLETLFWCTINDVNVFLKKNTKFIPEELEDLRSLLSFTYYSNFSLFQSSPDSWARGFVFPVAPIHRLNEEPEVVATLADLTCDSDGKVSCFSSPERRNGATKDLIELHQLNGDPYYIGMFLTGNQDNHLGSLHNLYGDTHVLVVLSDPDHPLGYNLKHTLPGNTIHDVLTSFQYDTREMLESVRLQSEAALKSGQLSLNHCKLILSHYSRSLRNYTYLSSDGDLDGLPHGFDSMLTMGETQHVAQSGSDNHRYIFTFTDSDVPTEFRGGLGGPPNARSPTPP